MIKFDKKVVIFLFFLLIYIEIMQNRTIIFLGCVGDDEVRLRAEIYIPTSLIGRLVGKGGHNVRLQFIVYILIKNVFVI